MSALETQVGGGHYKDMKIQPVEFIHANKIPFIEGNAITYICRHRLKGGAQDIRKAIHMLEQLIELEYSKSDVPPIKATDTAKFMPKFDPNAVIGPGHRPWDCGPGDCVFKCSGCGAEIGVNEGHSCPASKP